MADNKKSALLNAAKKLKNAGKPVKDESGNVKKTQNTNAAGSSLFDKIKNAVSKVDRD